MSVEMGSNDGRVGSGPETVAAVDEIDGRPHLVLAEMASDEAWIAVSEAAGVSLPDWE